VSPELGKDHVEGEQPLVCTVSTVRDTPANVVRFVDRNLAAGVDQMFLFLEGSREEAKEISHALEEFSGHVTATRVGPHYWNPQRPPGLNQRQVTNAGFVNCLLAPFPAAHLLFHIDGDECLDIDRDHLLALAPDVPGVRLRTREAVSRLVWDDEVDVFKRQLDHEELCLLTVLGVISGPTNGHYFHGHLAGKPGLRPNVDLRLRIHKVLDFDDVEIEPYEDDSLHVLHYESFSGEEFVRKWLAHLSSGPTPKFSAYKDQLRAAVTAVLRSPVLTEGEKQDLLHELYRRRVEDDLPTLDRLGLLVRLDPARHSHSPRRFSQQDARAVRRLFALLRRCDKRSFMHGTDGPRPIELLRDARQRLDDGTHLAERLDLFLAGKDSGMDAATQPSRQSSEDQAFRTPTSPEVTRTEGTHAPAGDL
jgi:hypothetical protein